MAVRIKDIAKLANCSEATVSLALNGSTLVNENTRKTILETAKKAGYIPNVYAKKLARRESRCLGLIIPDIENVFYASLVKHINAATKASGYNLITAISENSVETEKELISSMIENRAEGVILVPMNKANPDPSYVSLLDGYGIPYVFCADYYESLHGSSAAVMSDIEKGMYELTKEVVRMGYKNPAYLTGDNSVVSLRLREKGFTRAALELKADSCICKLETLDYSAAYDAVKRILAECPETDVFICVNDMIAAGVLNSLSEFGRSVPQTGVAGFDNVIFSRISHPQITTVEQNIREIAEKSVELLINKDEDKKDIIIPTKIIIRQSLTLKGEAK